MKSVVCIEGQGKVKDMQPRDLAAYTDLETVDAKVALILDGKTFAEDSMVIALGITVTGEKVLLGFVQTATEIWPDLRPGQRTTSAGGYCIQTRLDDPGILLCPTGLRPDPGESQAIRKGDSPIPDRLSHHSAKPVVFITPPHPCLPLGPLSPWVHSTSLVTI